MNMKQAFKLVHSKSVEPRNVYNIYMFITSSIVISMKKIQ